MKSIFYRRDIKSIMNVLGTVAFALAGVAEAATVAPKNIITSSTDVSKLFCSAMNWMFYGLMAVGVIMFLVGGYTYATSGGDAEKVSKATKTLTYAAIAVVVGLLARGAPILIGSFFLGNSGAKGLDACG